MGGGGSMWAVASIVRVGSGTGWGLGLGTQEILKCPRIVKLVRFQNAVIFTLRVQCLAIPSAAQPVRL